MYNPPRWSDARPELDTHWIGQCEAVGNPQSSVLGVVRAKPGWDGLQQGQSRSTMIRWAPGGWGGPGVKWSLKVTSSEDLTAGPEVSWGTSRETMQLQHNIRCTYTYLFTMRNHEMNYKFKMSDKSHMQQHTGKNVLTNCEMHHYNIFPSYLFR